MMSRAIALVSLLALIVAGCGLREIPSTSRGGSPAASALQRCGEVDSAGGLPGGGTTSTAYKFCLQIPLVDSVGTEQRIQVLLISDQASNPLADRTVLIYHPGGPGISAVDVLAGDPPPVDLATYVVVTWDGTTASTNKGSCGPDSTAFGTGRDPANPAAAAERTAKECRFGFGSETDVGAIAAAQELEQVRILLGADQIDLLMVSYGTAIGEAYLRLHPDHVRRAVLDAPIAMEVPWRDRLAAVESTLRANADRLVQECPTPTCRGLAAGSAPLTYQLVRDALLARRPAVGSGNVTLTPVVIDQATELSLHSQGAWEGYNLAVDQALAGDGTALWSLGEKLYFDLDRSVFYRSLCADIDRPSNAAIYAVPHQDLLNAYTSELAPCSGFPSRTLPAARSVPDKPDVLVIASRNDFLAPATLMQSAPVLDNISSTCVTDVIGHTSLREPKVNELVTEFLQSGDTASAAEQCDEAWPESTTTP